jgi:hypothetical protein
MSESPSQYDMYRVFQMSEKQAIIRVSENLRPLATQLLRALEALPHGVTLDSVSVKPSVLAFGEPIEVILPDEAEGE